MLSTLVTRISEDEILSRRDEMGLSDQDWSYVSSLFGDDSDLFYGSDDLFYKWGGELGTGAELTYSFVSGGVFAFDDIYYDDVEATGVGTADAFVLTANSDPSLEMVEFSVEQREFITKTLQEYDNISGLTFTEVADKNILIEDDTSYGDLRFTLQDFSAWVETEFQSDYNGSYDAGGFAYAPWSLYSDDQPWALAGDVFFDSKYIPYDGFFETTVTHEVGHALGLSHPFEGYGIIGNANDSLDNIHTVMTYDRDPALLGVNPMPIDILAMEFIYGEGGEANLGETSYVLDPVLFDNSLTDNDVRYGLDARMSIVDDGGLDEIDASLIDNGVFINLKAGSWSNLGSTDPYLAVHGQTASSFSELSLFSPADDLDLLNSGQLYVESSTLIEGCTLTEYDDLIFDNDADNIIECGSGNDRVSLSGGEDQVFGGEGYDEVSLLGTPDLYGIYKSDTDYVVYTTNEQALGGYQEVILNSVENISFFDRSGAVIEVLFTEDYWFNSGSLYERGAEGDGGGDDGVFETLATVPEDGSRLNSASHYDNDTGEYTQILFTDIEGTEHLVSDAPAEDVVGSGIGVSALDNGYHIITYSLLNSDGASADTYYRVFDAHSMEFVADETFLANHPNYVADRDNDDGYIYASSDPYYQYDGVAVIDLSYDGSSTSSETRIYLGYDDDGVFETLATVPEDGSRLNSASHYDNDTGEYTQILFTDIEGTEHLVSDAPAEDVVGSGIGVSALDNGYHIITYSLLNSDGASADTYYRVFDAHSMEFVADETFLANHPNYVADRDNDDGYIYASSDPYYQYDGVAVIDLSYDGSSTSSETRIYLGYDDDGVFETLATVPEDGSRLNSASHYDNDTGEYTQILFTDIEGTEHLVSDAPAEDVVGSGIGVSALDNGYHIITYSLLNSDGASADTYYRVFDAHSMEFVADETFLANHPNYVADRDNDDGYIYASSDPYYQYDGVAVIDLSYDGSSTSSETRIYLGYEVEEGFALSGDYENIILGADDDVFFGDETSQYVETGGGSDVIKTGGGDDYVFVESSLGNVETFEVTVREGKFCINGVPQAELDLVAGKTYIFDTSGPSNLGHPLQFSEHEDGAHNPNYYDGWYGEMGLIYRTEGNAGEDGSFIEFTVPDDYTDYFPSVHYWCENHQGMGSSFSVDELAPDNVTIDVGDGSDFVEVESDFVGDISIANGAGGDFDPSTLMVMINKEIGRSGLINENDLRIGFNGSDDEIIIEGYYTTDDQGFTTIAGTTILMEGWGDPEGIEVWNGGHTDSVFDWSAGTDGQDQFYSSALLTGEVDEEVVYALSGRDGDDVIHSGGGTNLLFGGEGDDIFYVSGDVQLTSIIADVETRIDGQYINPSLNEYGLPDYGSAAGTTNTNYADKVYIDWVYDQDSIAEISGTNGQGVVVWNDDLGARVEIYDAEQLIFRTEEGGWDAGISIGETAAVGIGTDPDDLLSWKNGHHGKSFSYSDDNVRFVLTDKPAADGGGDAPSASPNGDATSDWLQVYATVTSTESYTYYEDSRGRTRSSPKKGYDAKTGTREIEEEALIWEGDRTAVGKFAFGDIDIQVINVQEQDAFFDPILYTTGTEATDLIFGNQYANIIDGGGGDDIIFGGGGDDVLIGGEGDDVITGGEGDDIIRGDGIDTDDVAYEEIAAMAETLAELSAEEDPNIDISQKVDSTLDSFSVDVGNDGNDTILGGDGVDDIDSGDGENFVSSGRLELETEGETDLETLRDHIKSHKDIFDDDDWI